MSLPAGVCITTVLGVYRVDATNSARLEFELRTSCGSFDTEANASVNESITSWWVGRRARLTLNQDGQVIGLELEERGQ